MGDLSENFSKLGIMCPCSCGADKISPVLIEKLQKVRNIIGRPIIITSGVRCEFYNASLKNSGKQLVFGKTRGNLKKLKALHGASLPREFHREDMAKIFNKKIKTRFPILFKRALDFHLMKAQSRLR